MIWGGGFSEGPYRRSDELGDHLIHLRVPLHGILVLDTQRVKECMRPVAEVLLGIITPHRVLIIRKALDVEQLPRRESIVEHAAPCPPPHLDLDGAGRFATQREREHRAALGDVDVVGRSPVRRAAVEGLPGGWGQTFAHDGVVLEDEEEAALSDGLGLEGSVYVGLIGQWSDFEWGYGVTYLGLSLVPGRGHQVLEELVHVKVFLHRHVGSGEHERRGLLEDPEVVSRYSVHARPGHNSRHSPNGAATGIGVFEDPPDRGIPVVSVSISAGGICLFRLDLLRLRGAVPAHLVDLVGCALEAAALSRLEAAEDIRSIQLVPSLPNITKGRDGVLVVLINRMDMCD